VLNNTSRPLLVVRASSSENGRNSLLHLPIMNHLGNVESPFEFFSGEKLGLLSPSTSQNCGRPHLRFFISFYFFECRHPDLHHPLSFCESPPHFHYYLLSSSFLPICGEEVRLSCFSQFRSVQIPNTSDQPSVQKKNLPLPTHSNVTHHHFITPHKHKPD
jgi:hypothetical protein